MSAPAERPRLSACIIAKDEEARIEACLASLAFCDEIIVVDSHSTDRTAAICAAAGARVVARDWPGFGPQKAFAVSAAAYDWVLCLDADERVSDELRSAIEGVRDAGFPGHAGWSMPRCSQYLGRWIRHGSWYPDLQMRLFDRRRGNWNDAPVHEKVLLEGSVGRLAGDLEHLPYERLDDHLRTIDKYTTLMAESQHARGKRAGVHHLVFNPLARFLKFYVLRLGFLEGWRGFLLACLAAHYVRLKYAKLLALSRPDEVRMREKD
ncbi:MAG: glycosyltransferase family 2 protein [bacterium]|nr:glycosyltransferase family 2 protein [bacterium]